jgi:hypothetical protein
VEEHLAFALPRFRAAFTPHHPACANPSLATHEIDVAPAESYGLGSPSPCQELKEDKREVGVTFGAKASMIRSRSSSV